MTANENANMVEGLREIGFSDTQIADMLLMIEGRISIQEWKDRFDRENENK